MTGAFVAWLGAVQPTTLHPIEARRIQVHPTDIAGSCFDGVLDGHDGVCGGVFGEMRTQFSRSPSFSLEFQITKAVCLAGPLVPDLDALQKVRCSCPVNEFRGRSNCRCMHVCQRDRERPERAILEDEFVIGGVLSLAGVCQSWGTLVRTFMFSPSSSSSQLQRYKYLCLSSMFLPGFSILQP